MRGSEKASASIEEEKVGQVVHSPLTIKELKYVIKQRKNPKPRPTSKSRAKIKQVGKRL